MRRMLRRRNLTALAVLTLTAATAVLWAMGFPAQPTGASPGKDFEVTVMASPVSGSDVPTGSEIQYTVTLKNAGDTPIATGDAQPALRIWLGTGLTFLSVNGEFYMDCPGAGAIVDCNLAWMIPLPPGGTRTVTVQARVDAPSGNVVLFGAMADPDHNLAEDNEAADDPDMVCGAVGEGTDAGDTEPDNYDCVSHTVTAAAIDLTVTKAASPDEPGPVAPGSNITYTITVTKSAGGALQDVPLRDTLGVGLSLISVTEGTDVDCFDQTPPTIRCTVDFPSTTIQSRNLTVVAEVTAVSGSVLNGTFVDFDEVIAETNEDADDPALDCAAVGEGVDTWPTTEPDNFDCTEHSVEAIADLVLTKSGPSSVSIGGTATYTLTSTNDGVATASSYYIDDFIPTGVTVTAFTATDGADCAVGSDTTPPWSGPATIHCGPFTTPAAGSDTVTLTATVSAAMGSTVLNGALTDSTHVVDEANEDADDPELVCTAVGEGTDTAPATEPDNYDCMATSVTAVKGDMDCDGDVDAVDALLILRDVAGLSVSLPPGCPAIGS